MNFKEFCKMTFSKEFLREADIEYEKYKKLGEAMEQEMKYYHYGFLMNALGYPGDVVTDEEIDGAREFLQNLSFEDDVENVLIIKKWLRRFAKETYVQADQVMARAIARIEDPTVLIVYFANNLDCFWC